MTRSKQSKALTPSWDLLDPNYSLVREHYLILIYLYVLPGMVALLGSTLLGAPEVKNGSLQLSGSQVGGLILMLTGVVWQLVNAGPSLYFQLQAVRGKTVTLANIYRSGLRFSWRVILYYVCFGVATFVGLLLFIVPGFIVFRRYFFGTYYMVDRNYSVGDSLQLSAKTSKPFRKAIWGVLGVQLTFILAAAACEWSLGLIGSVVSVFIMASIVFLAPLRYREIANHKD